MYKKAPVSSGNSSFRKPRARKSKINTRHGTGRGFQKTHMYRKMHVQNMGNNIPSGDTVNAPTPAYWKDGTWTRRWPGFGNPWVKRKGGKVRSRRTVNHQSGVSRFRKGAQIIKQKTSRKSERARPIGMRRGGIIRRR